jgi:hypothetical protein
MYYFHFDDIFELTVHPLPSRLLNNNYAIVVVPTVHHTILNLHRRVPILSMEALDNFYVAHKTVNFQQIHLDTLFHHCHSIDTWLWVLEVGLYSPHIDVSNDAFLGVWTPS